MVQIPDFVQEQRGNNRDTELSRGHSQNKVTVPFLWLTSGCRYPDTVPFLRVVYVKRLSDVLTFESLLRTPKLRGGQCGRLLGGRLSPP